MDQGGPERSPELFNSKPSATLYWRPETVRLKELASTLRSEGVPVYFSSDTGATAYLNTTAEHADRVADRIESLGIDSRVWSVGGPATPIENHLF